MMQGSFSKALIFVDGSEACISAAQVGIVMAKQMKIELSALYVVNVSLLADLLKAKIFVQMEQMDYEQDLLQDGKRYLNYISQLAKAKNVSLTTELVKGVVNKEVTKKIEEWRIDLLIMGELEPIRSRADAHHDETELIFRKVPCSVLVVKNAERAERLYQAMNSEP